MPASTKSKACWHSLLTCAVQHIALARHAICLLCPCQPSIKQPATKEIHGAQAVDCTGSILVVVCAAAHCEQPFDCMMAFHSHQVSAIPTALLPAGGHDSLRGHCKRVVMVCSSPLHQRLTSEMRLCCHALVLTYTRAVIPTSLYPVTHSLYPVIC